ncbi:uncharacterized protein HD556DRAFT_1310754 [Suillus plorans]|uniref:Uncharacterized protein n=1 Tax=Suillus plorans TaxID=116603 RepID=A0A9P7DE11_9AGAM|nr:uncharacterized protein HD556DRAFT_1310754 [Suillus plorans]KAG1790366.1 hypothetical protein HD556DRAFT_1310754 [Suillus plorans]
MPLIGVEEECRMLESGGAQRLLSWRLYEFWRLASVGGYDEDLDLESNDVREEEDDHSTKGKEYVRKCWRYVRIHENKIGIHTDEPNGHGIDEWRTSNGTEDTCADAQRKRPTRCQVCRNERCQSLHREMEMSGPQVIAYLMNWGDVICLCHYVPLYWFALKLHLLEAFSELNTNKNHKNNMNSETLFETDEQVSLDEDSRGVGDLSQFEKDPARRYHLWNVEASSMKILFVHYYQNEVDAKVNIAITCQSIQSLTHRRVVRSEGHNTLPDIVGPFFPQNDPKHRELYCTSILTLLPPWHSIKDLRNNFESWDDMFTDFLIHTSSQNKDVIAGIQYYYNCKTTADDSHICEDEETGSIKQNEACYKKTVTMMDEEENEDEDISVELTIEDLHAYKESQKNHHEEAHALLAVAVGHLKGFFAKETASWSIGESKVGIASGDAYRQLGQWQMAIANEANKLEE